MRSIGLADVRTMSTDDKIEQLETRLYDLLKCAKDAGIESSDISNALLRALARNAPTLADAARLNMRARGGVD